MAHSRWTGYSATMDYGEHEGYRPGEFDPTTGITNPEQRGLVRGSYNSPDAVAGPSGHLAWLRPFTGHSLRATLTPPTEDNPNTVYTVYSYATIICQYLVPVDPEDGTEPTPRWYIDDDYYSHKTSEHQGMCRAWTGYQRGGKDLAASKYPHLA